MQPLIDGFGRSIESLRVSITDRCNFRCVYCMPPEGLPWLPSEKVLSVDELVRLAASPCAWASRRSG